MLSFAEIGKLRDANYQEFANGINAAKTEDELMILSRKISESYRASKISTDNMLKLADSLGEKLFEVSATADTVESMLRALRTGVKVRCVDHRGVQSPLLKIHSVTHEDDSRLVWNVIGKNEYGDDVHWRVRFSS